MKNTCFSLLSIKKRDSPNLLFKWKKGERNENKKETSLASLWLWDLGVNNTTNWI